MRPNLGQKLVKDIIVTDMHLMRESGEVNVDFTDLGMSDCFLVWLELDSVAKCCRRQKHTVRKWHLDRFIEDGVKGKYCQALNESFQRSFRKR